MWLLFHQILSDFKRSKNYVLYFCLVFVFILSISALFAEFIIPYPVNQMSVELRLKPPSSDHWFGTDNFGRDVLSRVIVGSRISLIIGLAVSVLSSLAGSFLGITSAMFAKLDNYIMRTLDGLMAFPTTILAIALVAVFGAGLWQEVLALSVVFAPRTARLMRGVALEIKSSDFVQAALVNGGSLWYVSKMHILRNGFGPLLVQATFVGARSIILDAGLSFLGLGVPPPTPTWGNMLGDAKNFIEHSWWFITLPGLVLILTVMSINVIGDALRDSVDPKMRR